MASSVSFELQRPESKALLDQLTEVQQVWKYFFAESPRVSHKLDEIRNKLVAFGKSLNLDTAVDKAGNVRIRRAAAAGFEQSTKIAIQSHMDMVCSSVADYDFETQPITPLITDGWMHCNGTTLGADDGIGVAASLALLADPTLAAAQIEALFTVDEETTMGGAEQLAGPPFLTSELLINVDSEEEHSVCVGCAGGFEKTITVPATFSSTGLSSDQTALTLNVFALKGGHTGVDIHRGRANAIQVLVRLLDALLASHRVQLVAISGGNAANAIPRSATAKIVAQKSETAQLQTLIRDAFAQIQSEFLDTESNEKRESTMKFAVSEGELKERESAMGEDDTRKVVDVLLSLPHGVIEVDAFLPGEIQTSISLSMVENKSEGVVCSMFCRSSSMASMKKVERQLDGIARLSGITITPTFGQFPGWKPNHSSAGLKQMLAVHEQLFQKSPRVYSIHAGLECGLIQGAYPDMDCVSIGPTIENAHSPDERIKIASVTSFYNWLRQSILSISEQSKHGAK